MFVNLSREARVPLDLAQVSGMVLEFLRRNSSLFLLECLLFQAGNPFRR
jgi:hypothetical protein